MVRRTMLNMRSPWMIRITKSMKQRKPPLLSTNSETKQMIRAVYTTPANDDYGPLLKSVNPIKIQPQLLLVYSNSILHIKLLGVLGFWGFGPFGGIWRHLEPFACLKTV